MNLELIIQFLNAITSKFFFVVNAIPFNLHPQNYGLDTKMKY